MMEVRKEGSKEGSKEGKMGARNERGSRGKNGMRNDGSNVREEEINK